MRIVLEQNALELAVSRSQTTNPTLSARLGRLPSDGGEIDISEAEAELLLAIARNRMEEFRQGYIATPQDRNYPADQEARMLAMALGYNLGIETRDGSNYEIVCERRSS